jgi:hypothetical protein
LAFGDFEMRDFILAALLAWIMFFPAALSIIFEASEMFFGVGLFLAFFTAFL